MHDSPNVRGRLSRRDVVNDMLKLGISKGLGWYDEVGVFRVSAAVSGAGRNAGYDGVPLSEPLGHGLVDGRLAQILGVGHGALDETVHHSILEAGKKLGSKAVSHEQLVVLGFAVAVNDQVGAVAVGAEQDGLLVYLILGEAGLLVDGLEECVGNAVGEANELDIGIGALPVGANGENELAGGGFRVLARVGQRNEANVMLDRSGAVRMTVRVAVGCLGAVLCLDSHGGR